MVKKWARAARVMVTRVVGNEEGGGDGHDNVGKDESTGQRLAYTLRTEDVSDDRTTTTERR